MVTEFGLAIRAWLDAKGLKDLQSEIDKVTEKAKRSTNALNNALGGKPIENSTRSLVTNLSAVGNRLGFMAFQWKFMAGAAEQALGTVFNALRNILQVGSQINTSVGQALAFATDIDQIAGKTALARKEMEAFQDKIVELGSGATIFNRGEIADIGKDLVKAFGDAGVAIDALEIAALVKQLDTSLDNEKLATGLVTLFEATGTDLEKVEGRVKRMALAMDFLTNVSDKSSLNFQSTIASFSKAAPAAKAMGLEATELGVALQLVGDVLGRNKSSGRAGSSAGTYTNAFLSDLRSIADETTKQGKAARDELLFGKGGFSIFESDGKTFLPLVREAGEAGDSIADVFKRHFGPDSGLGPAERAQKLSKLGLGDNSFLVANALIFDKTTEELQKMREELKEVNTLFVRSASSVQDTGSQLKRFEAAQTAVKAAFTAGLAPLLKELSDSISAFTSDKEFNRTMASIGIIIGDTIKPALKTVTKFFKILFNIFKKNDKILKAVVQGLLALLGAVVALFILGKLGFIISLVSASLITMSAQAWIGAKSLFAVAKGAFVASLKFLPFMLIMFGALSIILLLTDKVEGDLIPILGVLGTAATALGVAMLIPKGNMSLLSSAIGPLATALSTKLKSAFDTSGASVVTFANQFEKNTPTLAEKAKNLGDRLVKGLFGTEGGGFVQGQKGFLSKLTGFWQSLGKGGPILAAVAAAALLITAFVVTMEKEVENSTIFKTGLVDKWQQVGMRMTAATNVFLRQTAKFFVDLWEGIKGLFGDGANFVNGVLVALGAGWQAFWSSGFNINAAFDAFKKGMEDAFGNFQLGQTLGDLFDPTGVSGFTRELEKQLAVLEKNGFNRTDAVVTESIAELIKAWEIAAEDFGSTDIAEILDRVFGQASDQFIESQAQKDFNAHNAGDKGTTGIDVMNDEEVQKKLEELEAIDNDIIATQDKTSATIEEVESIREEIEHKKEQTGITKELNKIQATISKLTDKQKELMIDGIQNSLEHGYKLTDLQKELLRQNQATKDATAAEDINTKLVDENSINSIADSKGIIEHVDFLKLQIIEVARNINAISQLTTMIAKVNFTFAHIVAEGNRFAEKLASAWMDSKGKWHYKDPGISSSDQKLINAAGENFMSTAANQMVINISELKAELEKIQTQLSEANQIAADSQDAVKSASATAAGAAAVANQPSTIQDFYHPYNNPNYAEKTRLLRDEEGRLAIDINIDEVIDMKIEGGQLSHDQLIQLRDAVGSSVAEQIKEAILQQ